MKDYISKIENLLEKNKNIIKYELKKKEEKITFLKLYHKDKEDFRVIIEFTDYTMETLYDRIIYAMKESFGIDVNKKDTIINKQSFPINNSLQSYEIKKIAIWKKKIIIKEKDFINENLFNIKDLIIFNKKDIYEVRYVDEDTVACFNVKDEEDSKINPNIFDIQWIEKDKVRININSEDNIFTIKFKEKDIKIEAKISDYSYDAIEEIYNASLMTFEKIKLGIKP